jgi:dihydrofolate reductase
LYHGYLAWQDITREVEVRKVVVDEFMSLDGVVQAPQELDEDPSGGFAYGGWNLRFMDQTSMNRLVEGLEGAGGFLFGRRTYEKFASHWPSAPAEEQVVARPLNTLPKYVASRTLTEPLSWRNSTLLRGDIGEAVLALKQEDGNDLHVIGSTELVQSLITQDLVDELRLMIDPLLLGGGKRIFPDDGNLKMFFLVDGQITSTGALVATYARAGF